MTDEHRYEIAHFLASRNPGERRVVFVSLGVTAVYLLHDEVTLAEWWHEPTGRSVWAAISEIENTIVVTENVKELWAGETTRVLSDA